MLVSQSHIDAARGNRVCRSCGNEKPITAFSFSDRKRGYFQSDCKPCNVTRVARYHRDRAGQAEYCERRRLSCAKHYLRPDVKEKHHARNLREKYGITREQYQSMLKAQNGCCAICGTDDPGRPRYTRMHVDHVHDETKRVRGLLCGRCNIAIGLFQDDVNVLLNAAVYLTPPLAIENTAKALRAVDAAPKPRPKHLMS